MKVPLPEVEQGRVLADWVTASLREAILNGYFEPGEKLDQDRIAEELEVSRTPVREAIMKLFVGSVPQAGMMIKVILSSEEQTLEKHIDLGVFHFG